MRHIERLAHQSDQGSRIYAEAPGRLPARERCLIVCGNSREAQASSTAETQGAQFGMWQRSHVCQMVGFDLSSPFVDAALPGGECLHVAIPDATRADWAINIRKYVVRA